MPEVQVFSVDFRANFVVFGITEYRRDVQDGHCCLSSFCLVLIRPFATMLCSPDLFSKNSNILGIHHCVYKNSMPIHACILIFVQSNRPGGDQNARPTWSKGGGKALTSTS